MRGNANTSQGSDSVPRLMAEPQRLLSAAGTVGNVKLPLLRASCRGIEHYSGPLMTFVVVKNSRFDWVRLQRHC